MRHAIQAAASDVLAASSSVHSCFALPILAVANFFNQTFNPADRLLCRGGAIGTNATRPPRIGRRQGCRRAGIHLAHARPAGDGLACRQTICRLFGIRRSSQPGIQPPREGRLSVSTRSGLTRRDRIHSRFPATSPRFRNFCGGMAGSTTPIAARPSNTRSRRCEAPAPRISSCNTTRKRRFP